MLKASLTTFAALLFASQASAQTVQHYWDFESMTDVVGGLTTTAVGTPDMSLHGTYGEAYTGSNQSLNTVLGGTSAGGGFLEADVHDGVNATAMNFGTGDFSFSYWAYDDASDADARGARIFDNLAGTTEGIQLGTNLTNDYNLRLDDDQGGVTISNNTLLISMPTSAWAHVAVNVDRANLLGEVYFDGVSQGTFPLTSAASANILPSQDLLIGVINGGSNAGGAQQSGLDDLAFYDALLSASDIAGLASGTLTPLSFGGGNSGNPGCDGSAGQCPCFAFGAVDQGCPNSGSANGGKLVATGNAILSNDTFALSVTECATDKPGLVLSGTADLSPGVNTVSDSAGLLCVGGMTQRGAVVFTDSSGNASLPDFQGAPYGMASNVTAGSPSYYQYWFRDPNTACPPNDTPAGDFNFTNMWSVTWML